MFNIKYILKYLKVFESLRKDFIIKVMVRDFS